MGPQPRNAGSHQKLKEARERSRLEPLEGARKFLLTPWFQLHDTDLSLLASRIVRG